MVRAKDRGKSKRGSAQARVEKHLAGLTKLLLALALATLILLIFISSGALAATAPTVVEISPNPAAFTAGISGNLTAGFTDADGWQNLKQVFLIVSASPKQKANAVYLRYNQNRNSLSLRNDTNSSWTSCTPGTSKILANNQVSIDCAATSVRGSGDTLSLVLNIKFTQVVAGLTFPVYQRAVDDNGLASIWQNTGTLSVAGSGPTPSPSPNPTPPPPSTTGKYDWVSYYGSGNLAALGKFKLVDIDVEDGAGNYTAADVATLKAGGSTVISYLNIGAAETFRSYWPQASAFKLGSYQGWPGEYWMDVSNPGWRDLIVNTVAPQLVAKGVDGFYLDNIDVVDTYPSRADIRQGVVELVRSLRAKYPDKIIIGQTWGLTPLSDRGADGKQFYQYLNGISKEEVNSTYQGGYQKIPVAESDAMLTELASWKAKGLEVFTLDYAITESLASYDYNRSLNYGLRPYAANKDLDKVYLWPFAPLVSITATAATSAGPEVIITQADPSWMSLDDYRQRVLTISLRVVNVGDASAMTTQMASCQTAPSLVMASSLPSLSRLMSGESAIVTLRYRIPPGLSRFMLMPDLVYSDGTDTFHTYEMD